MKIKYFAARWGNTHLSVDGFLDLARASGYTGVEIALDPTSMDIQGIRNRCAAHGLDLVAQHPYAAGVTLDSLYANYCYKLEAILDTGPLLVNCHTGKDYFSVTENARYLVSAHQLSEKYGVPVAHESHRGRFAFCAATTLDYLRAFPFLKFTADFSHWCVVSESLLQDQDNTLNAIIPHCIHIHARVGYAQGPQVPHPGASEYQPELNAHLSWWRKILSLRASEGEERTGITTEFGPDPYMQALPFTRQPVADLWDTNLFMKNYLIKNLQYETA